jgi:ParB-like nuclease family protein
MSDGKPALPVLNLTVVYRPTNSIKPESRNARTHSKKQIAEIAVSIRQFGFANPLLIDVDGVLIAGHGRLLAAKSIGLDSAPTITLPHLDEAQRRALRLADNKIALNAGWDVDLLKLELKELADLEIGFDLSLTGFSTGEIDVLLSSKADPTTRRFLPSRPSPAPGSAISGFVASIALVAAMVATSTSFARSSATMLSLMRPSWIRPTTSGSAATRTLVDRT